MVYYTIWIFVKLFVFFHNDFKKGVRLFFDFFLLQSSLSLSLVFFLLVCSPDIVSASVGSYLSCIEPVISPLYAVFWKYCREHGKKLILGAFDQFVFIYFIILLINWQRIFASHLSWLQLGFIEWPKDLWNWFRFSKPKERFEVLWMLSTSAGELCAFRGFQSPRLCLRTTYDCNCCTICNFF